MMMMMTVMMLMTRGELFMRTYIILLFIPIIFLKSILTRYLSPIDVGHTGT